MKNDLPGLYTLINDLLPYLHRYSREEVVAKILSESSLIDDLMRNAETSKDPMLKATSLSLLGEIWSLEPTLITEGHGPQKV